jgi:hypothetical protein
MLTIEHLHTLGGQIAGDRVIFEGEFVEGILSASHFDPAPGTSLFEKTPIDKPTRARPIRTTPDSF